MRYTFFILACWSWLQSQGQEVKIFHKDTVYLEYHPAGICDHRTDYYHVKDSVVENGVLKIYYDLQLSKLKYEIEYRNYQMHGNCKYYSEKGTLQSFQSYNLGRLNGLQRFYRNDSEKLRFQFTYDDGKRVNEISYHENGQVGYVRIEKDSETVATKYHQNGQLHYEDRFLNGKHVDGELVKHFPDGTINEKWYYLSGNLDSIWIYYPNQILKERTKFLNGSVDWRYQYRENGELKAIQEFTHDRPYKYTLIQYHKEGGFNKQIRSDNKKIFDADFDANGNIVEHKNRGDLMHWKN